LGDYALKISMRAAQHAVIAVELSIREPESVISARVEPTSIILLGAVTQDCRGSAKIVGNAVDELKQIVGTGVEDRISEAGR
jgi:hypothetical protein